MHMLLTPPGYDLYFIHDLPFVQPWVGNFIPLWVKCDIDMYVRTQYVWEPALLRTAYYHVTWDDVVTDDYITYN